MKKAFTPDSNSTQAAKMRSNRSKHLPPPKLARIRKGMKILLVDNNHSDLSLFQAAFRALRTRHRLKVVQACKGALDCLNDGISKQSLPALIVLDVKMGGGFGMLRAIRRNVKLRAIPVIVLSSSQENADVYRAYELGANAYLCKPLDDFVDIVGHFERFWLRCARLPLH